MQRLPRTPVALMMAIALIVVACEPSASTGESASPAASSAPAAPSGASTAPSPSGEPVEQPQTGGTFIGVLGADPQGGNRNTATDLNTFYAFSGVFNALVMVDPEGNIQPDLADEWTVSDDGLTYTFNLNPDATFHDGTPVTSADVQYTIEEVAREYNSQARPQLANVEEIETPDEHTVVFNLAQPSAVFLRAMAHQFMVVLPKHIFEGSDPRENPANQAPIGSGPFKFEEWVAGDHITLVRNEDYFREGLPYFDRVVFQIIPEAGSRSIAFEAGDIDFVPGQFVAREQAEQLAGIEGVYVDDTEGPPGQELMFMNTTKAPLDDVAVRQAIAMAIDQQAIVDRAFFGIGATVPTSHFEAGLGEFHNSDLSFPAYDVDAANQALDDAGHAADANGTRFSLEIAYAPANDSDRRSAELVRDMLSDVGIAVTASPYDQATIGSIVFTDATFDLFTGSFTSNYDPQLGAAGKYLSTSIGVVNGNGSRYENPELDELFIEASQSDDTDVRAEAYWQIQEILMEDMPTLPLVDYMNVDFYRPELRGYDPIPLGFPSFAIQNVWTTAD